MKSISLSAARANLKSVMDRVVADRVPVTITRRRGEGVVLVSASEWTSIAETLYLLRSPKNAERLLASVREFERGGEGGHFLTDIVQGTSETLSSKTPLA